MQDNKATEITTLPPPCMSFQRAVEIYLEPWKRVIEYTNLCHVEGDIAEFGTFNGFTARMFAELMGGMQDKRTLWLYDSWEGFPEPEGNDVNCKEVKEGYWKKGDCAPILGSATPAKIKAELSQAILPTQIKTIQGFYKDTLKHENLPLAISVLHIDCDLYESTKLVLEKTAPLLSDGSIVLFDDLNNNLASNKFGERAALADSGLKLEQWFTYGWSGFAFIYHKD